MTPYSVSLGNGLLILGAFLLVVFFLYLLSRNLRKASATPKKIDSEIEEKVSQLTKSQKDQIREIVAECNKVIVPHASALLEDAECMTSLVGSVEKGLNLVIITADTRGVLNATSKKPKKTDRSMNASYNNDNLAAISGGERVQIGRYSFYTQENKTIICLSNGDQKDEFVGNVLRIKKDFKGILNVGVITQDTGLKTELRLVDIKAEPLRSSTEVSFVKKRIIVNTSETNLKKLYHMVYNEKSHSVRKERISLDEFYSVCDISFDELYPNCAIQIVCDKSEDLKVLLVFKVNQVKPGSNPQDPYEKRVEDCDHYFAVVQLPDKSKKSEFYPINVRQAFALHYCLDPTILIVVLIGKAGTGKSLMAFLAYLKYICTRWHGELSTRMYYLGMTIFKPLVVEGGSDDLEEYIGTLPGTTEEKTLHFFASIVELISHFFKKLGITEGHIAKVEEVTSKPDSNGNGKKTSNGYVGESPVKRLMNKAKISISHIQNLAGMTFSHIWMVLNEAQYVGFYRLYQFLSRPGEGSKIILEGDIDMQLTDGYIGKTPLERVVNKMQASPNTAKLIAAIELVDVERSYLAKEVNQVLGEDMARYNNR